MGVSSRFMSVIRSAGCARLCERKIVVENNSSYTKDSMSNLFNVFYTKMCNNVLLMGALVRKTCKECLDFQEMFLRPKETE